MAAPVVGVEPAPEMLRLPFTPTAVSDARATLRTWLRDAGVESDYAYDARLVISELVGNAIRHAQPLPDDTLVVAWELDRHGIHITVTDGGGTDRPQRVRAEPTATSGRGMAIIESLALRWWTDKGRTRTTVHALVPIA